MDAAIGLFNNRQPGYEAVAVAAHELLRIQKKRSHPVKQRDSPSKPDAGNLCVHGSDLLCFLMHPSRRTKERQGRGKLSSSGGVDGEWSFTGEGKLAISIKSCWRRPPVFCAVRILVPSRPERKDGFL